MNWDPLIITFKLAMTTTLILFVIAIPISYWLAYTKAKYKPIAETIISMPLVLPPTVLGFYFLIAFSPNNIFGKWLQDVFGIQLVFSFSGLIIASIIYSLPFMVHPLQSGLSGLPSTLKEASYMLGKSRFETLIKVLLPNIKPSVLTGLVLTFAHTVGEFGVVLMIGGNIPGKTKVASIAIYDEVETLNYSQANFYSSVLFLITFCILLLVYISNGGYFKRYLK
jgi:molybdate transport system permease protein